MTFAPITIHELCDEHTAIHFHFPEARVPGLVNSLEQMGAFIAQINLPPDADSPEALAELFSRQLNFPRITTNWDGVNDWATDVEFVGNPVASLIIVDGLDTLVRQEPRYRDLPIALWTRGPRRFQFQEQAFHVVLVGDDPPGVDIAVIFEEWVPRDRISTEMLANIGYGSNRIPVYDWQTDPPTLLIE